MHRDRDFDPQRLLSRRQKESRFRRSDQTSSLDQLLPWNERALRQDLGLDVVFREMARDDAFLFEVAQVAVLSSVKDPDTIRYRQDILNDCSRNEPIVWDMYALAIEAIERKKRTFRVSHPLPQPNPLSLCRDDADVRGHAAAAARYGRPTRRAIHLGGVVQIVLNAAAGADRRVLRADR